MLCKALEEQTHLSSSLILSPAARKRSIPVAVRLGQAEPTSFYEQTTFAKASAQLFRFLLTAAITCGNMEIEIWQIFFHGAGPDIRF